MGDSATSEVEAIRKKAESSSFYSAMRLMAPPEREAMFAIYAFCRLVDDIADEGKGTRADRHRALLSWRIDLEALYAGRRGGKAAFLERTIRIYGLRKADFLCVIDGMEMDVAEDICAPDLATLDLYCERVASAVGRLSIKVFGMDEDAGFALAHHLGRALQLTNILRDIDEDAGIHRLYLPREFLERAGVPVSDPKAAIIHPGIDAACREVAKLAHEHYRQSTAILKRRPRGNLRAPRLMGAVYAQILARMEKQGWRPPRDRVSISKTQLMMVVLKHGLL
ncbi:MAG: presqualene diphosphate synthase HpnD [Alphaproteobacteria bacterium]|nr:presqualene diphosphate synthase HpnD [Alphaproteobacteria bacterium]